MANTTDCTQLLSTSESCRGVEIALVNPQSWIATIRARKTRASRKSRPVLKTLIQKTELLQTSFESHVDSAGGVDISFDLKTLLFPSSKREARDLRTRVLRHRYPGRRIISLSSFPEEIKVRLLKQVLREENPLPTLVTMLGLFPDFASHILLITDHEETPYELFLRCGSKGPVNISNVSLESLNSLPREHSLLIKPVRIFSLMNCGDATVSMKLTQSPNCLYAKYFTSDSMVVVYDDSRSVLGLPEIQSHSEAAHVLQCQVLEHHSKPSSHVVINRRMDSYQVCGKNMSFSNPNIPQMTVGPCKSNALITGDENIGAGHKWFFVNDDEVDKITYGAKFNFGRLSGYLGVRDLRLAFHECCRGDQTCFARQVHLHTPSLRHFHLEFSGCKIPLITQYTTMCHNVPVTFSVINTNWSFENHTGIQCDVARLVDISHADWQVNNEQKPLRLMTEAATAFVTYTGVSDKLLYLTDWETVEYLSWKRLTPDDSCRSLIPPDAPGEFVCPVLTTLKIFALRKERERDMNPINGFLVPLLEKLILVALAESEAMWDLEAMLPGGIPDTLRVVHLVHLRDDHERCPFVVNWESLVHILPVVEDLTVYGYDADFAYDHYGAEGRKFEKLKRLAIDVSSVTPWVTHPIKKVNLMLFSDEFPVLEELELMMPEGVSLGNQHTTVLGVSTSQSLARLVVDSGLVGHRIFVDGVLLRKPCDKAVFESSNWTWGGRGDMEFVFEGSSSQGLGYVVSLESDGLP